MVVCVSTTARYAPVATLISVATQQSLSPPSSARLSPRPPNWYVHLTPPKMTFPLLHILFSNLSVSPSLPLSLSPSLPLSLSPSLPLSLSLSHSLSLSPCLPRNSTHSCSLLCTASRQSSMWTSDRNSSSVSAM